MPNDGSNGVNLQGASKITLFIRSKVALRQTRGLKRLPVSKVPQSKVYILQKVKTTIHMCIPLLWQCPPAPGQNGPFSSQKRTLMVHYAKPSHRLSSTHHMIVLGSRFSLYSQYPTCNGCNFFNEAGTVVAVPIIWFKLAKTATS